MTYDALTIDTQVVYSNDLELNSGLIGQLDQFKGGLVKFLLSEIVLREIHKALTGKAKSSQDALHKAIKSGSSNNQFEQAQIDTLSSVLNAMDKPADHTKRQLEGFIDATGGEIVSAEKADLKEILDKYFKNEPPFASKGKKNEFPDAIALISLEKWAIENEKRILAVSDDGDWKTFAAKSEHIDVVDDLGKALTLLNELAEDTVPQAKAVLNLIRLEDFDLLTNLQSSLENEVDSEFPYLEFDAPMPGEDEGASLSLVDYQIHDLEDGKTEINIIRVGTKSFAFRVPAHLVCNVHADISFSIRDSIDKDYVPMGSTSIEQEIEFDAFLMFEINHFLNDEEDESSVIYEIDNLELLGAPKSVDIGYVDYSLADEDYEFDF